MESAIVASSRWPADESQSKHYYAKNDAVINKRTKRTAAEVMQEPGDDQAAGNGADRHAHQKGGFQDGVQLVRLMHIPKRFGGRAGDGGGGKQEGKAGGGLAG